MKNKISTYILNSALGLVALFITQACAPKIDDYTPSTGTQANFDKYIAVGNSLTAGYADDGLYLEGQKVAYPNLIAQQLQQLGKAKDFNSPFFPEGMENGSGYLQLVDLVTGQPVLNKVNSNLAYTDETKKRLQKYTDDITNLGMPGMRMDMSVSPLLGIPEHGNLYFERVLNENQEGVVSYLEYAATKEHTFFTFWLGNNDVLGYATNGAVEEGPTSTLTDIETFTYVLNEFLEKLTAENQKGAIATIPDVTAIPFLTTVTKDALLAGVNAQNPPQPITDLYIATKSGVREAANEDMFVLPFSTAGLLGQPNEQGIPYGLHPLNPIEDKYVLDSEEAATVSAHVKALNQVIKEQAQSRDLALVDTYTFLNRVKAGIIINDMPVNGTFIQGNAFSLDGVHLTPLGNAIVANLFIEAINKNFKSSIPKVDVTNYGGVKFPNN